MARHIDADYVHFAEIRHSVAFLCITLKQSALQSDGVMDFCKTCGSTCILVQSAVGNIAQLAQRACVTAAGKARGLSQNPAAGGMSLRDCSQPGSFLEPDAEHSSFIQFRNIKNLVDGVYPNIPYTAMVDVRVLLL